MSDILLIGGRSYFLYPGSSRIAPMCFETVVESVMYVSFRSFLGFGSGVVMLSSVGYSKLLIPLMGTVGGSRMSTCFYRYARSDNVCVIQLFLALDIGL